MDWREAIRRTGLAAAALWLAGGSLATAQPMSGFQVELMGYSGPVVVQGVTFLAADQGGHFGFDTLVVEESISQASPVDIQVRVTGLEPGGAAMIAIDKLVDNTSDLTWWQYQFQIGHNLGDDFAKSCECDSTFFKTDPVPRVSTRQMWLDHWVAYDEPDGPDVVTFTGRLGYDDQPLGYWLALRVTDAFDGDPLNGESIFTIRQIPGTFNTIPEPGSAILALLGTLGVWGLGRRRQ